MSKPIVVLRDTHPLPVLDACKWEKLAGDPHTVNLNAYTSEDGSKIMGTWICTPGKWRVAYEKWEYCHFQEGYCVITPDGQEPIHLRAGDIFCVGRTHGTGYESAGTCGGGAGGQEELGSAGCQSPDATGAQEWDP